MTATVTVTSKLTAKPRPTRSGTCFGGTTTRPTYYYPCSTLSRGVAATPRRGCQDGSQEIRRPGEYFLTPDLLISCDRVQHFLTVRACRSNSAERSAKRPGGRGTTDTTCRSSRSRGHGGPRRRLSGGFAASGTRQLS